MIHYMICQMCYNNSHGRFYWDLTLKPSWPVSQSLLRWQFIMGERTDKHIKSHSSIEKCYLKFTGQFVGKKLKAKSLRPRLQSWHGFGLPQAIL